ncbi:MAG: hypothetical protein ACP5OG_03645 [Candidatus Nanoarchaeia archaeon]
MLEQILSLQKTNPREQKNYDSRALDYLGALKLYTGTIGPMFNYGPLAPLYGRSEPLKLPSAPLKQIPEIRYITEQYRFDEHEPFGKHLNYETLFKKKGKLGPRYGILSNIHIDLNDEDK